LVETHNCTSPQCGHQFFDNIEKDFQMANWTVSASSITAQAQAALWISEVWREARVNSFWGSFMGEGPNNVIHVRKDFMKNKGDQMHYSVLSDLTGKGRAGSALQSNLVYAASAGTRRLEGNEEAPTPYVDTVTLDQLRHGVITGGELSEQRLSFEMRMEIKNTLAYWWTRIVDEICFKKLSGTTFQDDGSNTFGEAATANTNILRPGNKTTDNDLLNSDTFSPSLVRIAKTAAKTGIFGTTTIWRMRPMILEGKPWYGCALHPYQVYDLQGTQEWGEAHRQIDGLRNHSDNPIFTGALNPVFSTVYN
jgi:N4-gp56 family major capsid protein